MKRFTIPCDFAGKKAPFHVYIGDPKPAHHPLQHQASWLTSQRGGTIPQEVMDSFQKLYDLAEDNHVVFEDLCVYALGAATKKKELMENADPRIVELAQQFGTPAFGASAGAKTVPGAPPDKKGQMKELIKNFGKYKKKKEANDSTDPKKAVTATGPFQAQMPRTAVAPGETSGPSSSAGMTPEQKKQALLDALKKAAAAKKEGQNMQNPQKSAPNATAALSPEEKKKQALALMLEQAMKAKKAQSPAPSAASSGGAAPAGALPQSAQAPRPAPASIQAHVAMPKPRAQEQAAQTDGADRERENPHAPGSSSRDSG